MYKNLNPQSVGVSGRQSELIEMSLTFGFKGFDIDLSDLARRVERHGLEHAGRFLSSAQRSALGLRLSGFDLPVRWQGDEIAYKEDMSRLGRLAEIAAAFEVTNCYATAMPASDSLAYDQNVEFHRRRLSDIADALAPHNLRLSLGFTSMPAHRKDKQHEFVCRVDQFLSLLDALRHPNIGAIVDAWHWHFGGGSLDQVRQLGADRIAMVRLANAPADVDPQQVTDKARLLPNNAEGAIDAVAWLTTLGEMEYEGGLTPYPHSSQFFGSTRERIVASVAESLNAVWKAAGLNRAGKLAPEEDLEAAPPTDEAAPEAEAEEPVAEEEDLEEAAAE